MNISHRMSLILFAAILFTHIANGMEEDKVIPWFYTSDHPSQNSLESSGLTIESEDWSRKGNPDNQFADNPFDYSGSEEENLENSNFLCEEENLSNSNINLEESYCTGNPTVEVKEKKKSKKILPDYYAPKGSKKQLHEYLAILVSHQTQTNSDNFPQNTKDAIQDAVEALFPIMNQIEFEDALNILFPGIINTLLKK